MSVDAGGVLGMIAGGGGLPLAMARSARRRGRCVSAIALRGQADPRLEEQVSEIAWLHPGEIGAMLEALRAAGVRDAVMAGRMPKALLYDDAANLHLDERAVALLRGLADRADDSILGALADLLQAEGIRLIAQAELVPELLPGPGVLGAVAPSDAQRADVTFGWPIARAIAGLDVGQTIVVKDCAVLAVEAVEGTDAAIRRAGEVASGGCVVKVAKPRQDPRFDVPTVGPETLEVLSASGASLLAFEAERTLVLDLAELIARADAAGIVAWAVDDAIAGPAS
jgi:DUF1009 family protein